MPTCVSTRPAGFPKGDYDRSAGRKGRVIKVGGLRAPCTAHSTLGPKGGLHSADRGHGNTRGPRHVYAACMHARAKGREAALAQAPSDHPRTHVPPTWTLPPTPQPPSARRTTHGSTPPGTSSWGAGLGGRPG